MARAARTLGLLKPDVAVVPAAVDDVFTRIGKEGLVVARTRTVHWSLEDAEHFYAEHKGRFFYDRLVQFMSR